MYQVDISAEEGSISILKKVNGNWEEVVYWECTEWEDDPEVVFNIVEAIRTALTDPVKMNKILKKMGRM